MIPRNEDDMGDGVPTDQLSHNHCDCTDSHCNSHIVASCVFVALVPITTKRRRRRVPSTMSTRWTASRATPSMRCQSQRMRTRRASLVSSGQDTNWSRHDLSRHVSRCLFLSHTPSQDQQTTADKGTFHFVTSTAPSVIEYVAPTPTVAYTGRTSYSDRVRGARTCCLQCSTSANDRVQCPVQNRSRA